MPACRLVLAPSVPALAALGVDDPVALAAGELGPRAELLGEAAGALRARAPLPGTPGPDGRRGGKPSGAGTGWIRLRAWRTPAWSTLLRARFVAPRSASLAEREWNLLCHLRSAGVGTAEPLAVGALGDGLVARRSFLVTRELAGYLPLAHRAAGRPAEERRRTVAATGAFLGRLLRSRLVLPRLGAEELVVRDDLPGPAAGEGEACGDEAPGPRNRLPGIALAAVPAEEGRIAPRFEARAAARMLAPLGPELAAAGATRAELAAGLRRALRALAPDERRALVAALRRLA